MIIHRIRLSRTACFAEPVEVGPLEAGLNVLAADNEEGKSTLVRAAARALFDRYSGKSREIRALQPAGTDLAPGIEVEFSAGKGRFRVEKQFLAGAESRLYQKNGSDWELIAEDDAADGRVLELVGGEPPGAGATRPQHWGLLRYLWARQDELAAWPSWDDGAGRRIRATLARVPVDATADALEAAFNERFQENFTPTGQVRRNGALHRLEEEIEAFERERRELEERRLRMEARQEEFVRLSEALTTLKRERDDKAAESARLSEEARRAELAEKDVKTLRKARDAAGEALETVESDAAKIREGEKQLADIRLALDKDEAAAKEREGRLESIDRRLEEAAREAKTGEEKARRIKREREDVRRWLRLAEGRSALAEKKELLEKVEERRKTLANAEASRRGLPRVSEAELKRLRKRSQEVRDLRNQLASSGLFVFVEPLRKASLEAETDDGRETREVPGGKEETFSAAREIVLRLSGWGTIRVKSGAEEVREKEKALLEAEEEMAAVLREHGADTFEALEAGCAEARELDASLKNLGKSVTDLLGKHVSPEALREAVAELETELRRLESAGMPEDSLMDSGADLSGLSEIRAREATMQTRMEAAEKEAEDKRTRLETLRKERDMIVAEKDKLGGELARLRNEAARLETRIREWAARYGNNIEDARKRARGEFAKAEGRLEEAEKSLPADWEVLPKRQQRAVAAAEAARLEYENRNALLLRLEGELEHQGAEGLYSRETQLRERLEMKREEAAALRRAGTASGFLASLLAFRKRETFERVLGPLEEGLSARFAELTGKRDRRVFLDRNLQVAAIGRDRESGIPFESLSQGAKEQLLLAMRVAVAMELTGEEEPQLLILDDVLVNTDPTRQQRVLDFLESAGRSVQILVLTCHPDRYRGVGTPLELRRIAD